MKMDKRGVTLVELIMVLVIIAIGAALTIPNLGAWVANYRLRTATRDIVSTLRTAQMRAVSTNLEHRVSLDLINRTYLLQRRSGTNWENEGAIQALPRGITLSVNPGNVQQIQFNPNSTTTPGITMTLTLQEARNNAQRRIRILSSTGKITVLE